ncbi:hypothetical protein RJ527_01795 [Thalassospiraceae bacterium LMO-SO8]|nr:hypothetical protein [Alphaproteobacteria bacterium LMO-S08]WND76488.1 hypothetical protein RJ527_01795 [Thalassospiraceae bacterium LMO-SO8]
MSPIFSFALETIAMIASLTLVQAAVLMMRHANRAAWLKRDAIDTLLAIAVGATILVAIGLEADSLIRIGLHNELAVLAAPVICAAAAKIIWHGFNCRARRAMAEAGMSPFGRLTDTTRQLSEQARGPKAG